MSNVKTHLQTLEKNPQPEKGKAGRFLQDNNAPRHMVECRSQTGVVYYISPEIANIHPADYMPVVQSLLPSKHELFLEVLADDELYQIFRQKAAEAFCKGEKSCFLSMPAFPFCFVLDTVKKYPYIGRSICYSFLLHDYELADLALIAEQLIHGNQK